MFQMFGLQILIPSEESKENIFFFFFAGRRPDIPRQASQEQKILNR